MKLPTPGEIAEQTIYECEHCGGECSDVDPCMECESTGKISATDSIDAEGFIDGVRAAYVTIATAARRAAEKNQRWNVVPASGIYKDVAEAIEDALRATLPSAALPDAPTTKPSGE